MAAFPLRVTVQGHKSNLKQNKVDIKVKTVENLVPDYTKSVIKLLFIVCLSNY